MMGLPGKWSLIAYIATLFLIPVAFFYPYLANWASRVWARKAAKNAKALRTADSSKSIAPLRLCVIKMEKPYRSRYGLFTRGVAVLMAYLIIISPPVIQNLAEAATQYSRLTTSQWANAGTIITYQYDDNGSMTQKLEDDNGSVTTTIYIYNLQNRLQRVETTPPSGPTQIVEYIYNDKGIRVQKIEDPEGTPVVTTYLVDEDNPTRYAQVLEETIDDGSSTLKTVTYTLGDDVVAQAQTDWSWSVDHWEIATQYDTQTLLYGVVPVVWTVFPLS